MQTNHANALRGLSIAVVIISGLAILACVIGVIFVVAGGGYLANVSPDVWEYYLSDGDYSYEYYGVDGSDMAAVVALMVAAGGTMLGAAILFTLPALIAGILGLRNYNNPAKLGLVFGWSLAGAITALLSGNMVTMVLLIIMCVFAYKDKQLAAVQPIVIEQPVVMGQPVPPVAPVAPAVEPPTPVATAEEIIVTEESKTE